MLIKHKLFFLFFGFLSSITVYARSYPVIEYHIQQKQYGKAYKQALKQRSQNEGDPRFDYLYGLSALETGHYNEAVFALDRVTVANPNVIRPRLDLARAYLKLNNKKAAIKEFQDVLSLSPPPNVKNNVGIYIAELQRKDESSKKAVIKKLTAFSIGYDSNINFGTENSEIKLPGFGLVTLNDSVVKQQSGFAEAKFQLMREAGKRQKSTFFLANINHRKYFKKTDFDFTELDLRTGFSINRKNRQYQLNARSRPVFLDGNLYSNTLGIDAILKKQLNQQTLLNTSISLENYHNNKKPLTDRNRGLLGITLGKTNGRNQYLLGFHLGKEFPEHKAGKQFSRNILGLAFKTSHEWNAKNTSFLNLNYNIYKHQAAYPVFPDKRKDNRYSIRLTHEFQTSDKAILVFSASHIANESNLNLYDVNRNEIKMGIRYEWD